MHQIWLLFLGLATGLVIKLRRVLRRLSPLNDELHSKQVAIAHVQSGVAWVRADLTFGAVNQSFAETFRMQPGDFTGREWYKIFGSDDHERIREVYGQMMLRGMTSFDATGERSDGSLAWLDVRLVPVHDRQMRFVGHHCMIADKSRERELEQQIHNLKERLELIALAVESNAQSNARNDAQANAWNDAQAQPLPTPNPHQPVEFANGSSASGPPVPSSSTGNDSLDALRRATGRSVISALDSLRKSPIPEPELPLTGKH
jgi:PAS domain S-box-containing protein